MFNGRETPTGLRDVRLELVRDENLPIKSRPEDLATGTPLRAGNLPPGLMTYDKLQVINLPPRQYVHKGLKGRFEREGAEALTSRRWRSIDFVGELPGRPIFGILGSKTYRKTITEPSN